MTKPALFAKGRPAAIRTASEFTILGMDADDLRQEALLSLWVGLDNYDPSLSSVPSFARMVATRRLTSLWRSSTRLKRTDGLPFGIPPAEVETLVLQREQLQLALTDPRIETRKRWRDNKRRQRAAA